MSRKSAPNETMYLALREIVRRQLVEAEHLAIGRAHRLVVERARSEPAGRPAPRSTRRGDRRRSRAPRPLSTATLPPASVSLPASRRDRVVPGDLAEAGRRRRAAIGRLDAARIVQPLQRRLAAGAELALIDRVLGIALELDRAALAGAHVQAAPRVALGAGAGVPGGDAGNLIFRLHQVGHQLLDPARWSSRRARARPAPVAPTTVRNRRRSIGVDSDAESACRELRELVG